MDLKHLLKVIEEPDEDIPSDLRHGIPCAQEVCVSMDPEGLAHYHNRLVETVERGFDKVGVNLATMAEENETLKRNLAEQVGVIGQEVEPKYFQWILTVLATGSLRAAAALLGIKRSTFSDKLRRFASRGGTYCFLYDLVKVRRKVLGTHRLEHFNEEYLAHQGADADFDEESFLKDLISALEAQNEKNWPQVKQEIIDLLAEHIG